MRKDIFIFLFLLCSSSLVLAIDKEKLYVKGLVATCASCHGTNGQKIKMSVLSKLSGIDKSYFITQMNLFKKNKRKATIMHQLSKGYTEKEINLMADFFSSANK